MKKEVDLSHFPFGCLAGRKIENMYILKLSKANLYHSIKGRGSIKSTILYRVEVAAALILMTIPYVRRGSQNIKIKDCLPDPMIELYYAK